jgi:hypothetical protein
MSQISRKLCPFRYRKPPRHQTDLSKIKLLYGILSLKQQAQRTECFTYKGKYIKNRILNRNLKRKGIE